MTEEKEENIFIRRRREDIEGLELAEQKVWHLLQVADNYSIPDKEKRFDMFPATSALNI